MSENKNENTQTKNIKLNGKIRQKLNKLKQDYPKETEEHLSDLLQKYSGNMEECKRAIETCLY